ncbi:MAG: hypothetical protein N2045_13875 [Fimbriimonadales bacterium]|nr:hypothetical protein [Fimbriimonadales bacterium]
MSYQALKTLAQTLEAAGYTVKWPGQKVPLTGPYIALDIISATPNNAFNEEAKKQIRVQLGYWKNTRGVKEVLEADEAIAALLTPSYPRVSAAQVISDDTWLGALSDYIVIG